jgi:hypothetical protein
VHKLILILLLFFSLESLGQSRFGPNDTLVVPYIVYGGDTMTYAQLDMVIVWGKMSNAQRKANREWTRLRNAVYVTYPYAKKASYIINDVNSNLKHVIDEKKRKQYLSSREKVLKKEFTEPLTNLSVYQGKVLMKLINRQTGNNCYELLKEYKGGVNARLYQTVAFFFGGNLKQDWEPNSNATDRDIENIIREIDGAWYNNPNRR